MLVPHACASQGCGPDPRDKRLFPELLECRNHAGKSVAIIRLSRPQGRIRRAALLPPAEELLANAVVLPLYSASGEAVGISAGLARLFGSCPPALQAILDALRMEGRRGPAGLRSALAPCVPDGRVRSAHGRDGVRALDGQRFPTGPALG